MFLVGVLIPALLPGNLRAQATQAVTGKVIDLATGNKIAHAAIKLLYHGDTVARTKTNDTGAFFFYVRPETDTFFIEADHTHYLTGRQAYLMSDLAATGAGIIYLTPEPQLLQEVVIRSKPSWRQDTVTFTADSFVVRQYATASELLQLIPGIQVLANGNILYNNIPVSMISIDGTPLLNFDQGQLLQLLRGRDIDQLRIFTDNSRDRNIQQTNAPKQLDIVLKEAAKHGYSGKTIFGAGGGNTAAWAMNTNISSFAKQQKIIAYIRGSNRGETDAPPVTDISPLQAQQGIPVTVEAGVYYNRNFLKDDKLSISINAAVKNNTAHVTTSTNTTCFLPDSILRSGEQGKAVTTTRSGNIGISAHYTFEPGTYLDASLNTGISASVSDNTSDVTSYIQDHVVSRSLNSTKTKGSSVLNFLNLTYNKSFRKPARALTITVSPNYNTINSNGSQHSVFNDFNNATTQETDQRKLDDKNDRSLFVSVNYNEPITKNTLLMINAQSGYTASVADNRTFDHFTTADQNSMDTLNPLYSNSYRLRNYVSKITGSLSGRLGRITANAGLELGRIAMQQTDPGTGTTNSKVFASVLPYLQLSGNIRKVGYLSFQYRLSAIQPGIDQLQPLTRNNDPMHQLTGNPDLQQSMTHSFVWSLIKNNAGQTRLSNVGIGIQFTDNAITLKQNINVAGQEFSQYYNQDGNASANLSYTHDRTISKRLHLSLGGKYTLQKTPGYVNDLRNTSLVHQLTGQYSFRYVVDTQLSINGGMLINHAINHLSPEQTNSRMLGISGMLNIAYTLPLGIMLTSSLNWQYTSGTNTDKVNNILWNASIARYLTKDGRLTMRISAYDLLHKNKGYMLTNENNVIVQSSFNTISRYIMLHITCNFTRR